MITDGPFPESKELRAGYRLVDVGSLDRAIEIAAGASAAPGPNGQPIGDHIEVRPVISAPLPPFCDLFPLRREEDEFIQC